MMLCLCWYAVCDALFDAVEPSWVFAVSRDALAVKALDGGLYASSISEQSLQRSWHIALCV